MSDVSSGNDDGCGYGWLWFGRTNGSSDDSDTSRRTHARKALLTLLCLTILFPGISDLMFESAARKPARLEQPAKATEGRKAPLNRKIWLPKFYYDALPWFYLFAGVAALLATLYINAWFWILPHSLLFSAACIHFSVYVFHRRRRSTRDRPERHPDQPPAI